MWQSSTVQGRYMLVFAAPADRAELSLRKVVQHFTQRDLLVGKAEVNHLSVLLD